MSNFTDDLTITALADGRTWRCFDPLTYEVGAVGSGKLITVPKGFETDGASVPRPLWWFLPSWGTYSRAAVVHDYLCTLLDANTPHALAPDRRTADAIFFEAMVVLGTGAVMRWLMWAAVRLYAIGARK